MGKGHRDNTAARKKRGSAAKAKRKARRGPSLVCGTRPEQRLAKCEQCGGEFRKDLMSTEAQEKLCRWCAAGTPGAWTAKT